MRIVFAGIIGRYPFGGVTWCSLMYLVGLRDLGHEVCYLEDTGECIYDADADARAHTDRHAHANQPTGDTGRLRACDVRVDLLPISHRAR